MWKRKGDRGEVGPYGRLHPTVPLGVLKPQVPLTFVAVLFMGSAAGQSNTQTQLPALVAELHAALDRAYTIMWEEAWADSVQINQRIQEALLRLLAVPMADSTLERVTTHHFLQNARSEDGRLWTFNWYENTGGSFHSFCHVFFHRTPDGRGFASGDDEQFCNGRAPFYRIHDLRSKDHPGLYLAMGRVRGCGTCCDDVAVVFQLIGDSLNLAYPAFADAVMNYQTTELQDETPSSACYTLGARCGDLLEWEFDERKQRINYVFRVDDLSPVYLDDDTPDGIVRGTLQFDGERFTEKMGVVEPDTYPKP